MIVNNNIWLVVEPYPSEKCEFLSWDYDIPFFFGKMENSCSSHHQPDGNIMGIFLFSIGNGWFKIHVSTPKMDERMGFVEFFCLLDKIFST